MEKGSTPEMPKHSARKVFRLSGAFATRFAAGGDFRYNSYASFAAEAAKSAPLAQLDRASGYEPEGREFESLRAHHFLTEKKQVKREPRNRLFGFSEFQRYGFISDVTNWEKRYQGSHGMASRTCNVHQIAQETDVQNGVRRKECVRDCYNLNT